jgi:hypothetical protein
MLGGRGVVAASTMGTGTINRTSPGSGSGSSSANWRKGSRRI